jgi:hypothetical protein
VAVNEGEIMLDGNKVAVQKVVEEAYIKGIHGDQNLRRVKGGFHEEFAMLVLNNNNIDKVNVDEWLNRIAQMKRNNPELWNSKTSYDFRIVDITKNAAVAKLNVYKGTTHFSTDYMLLYKFDEGWKIVSKIFAIP